MNSYSKARRSGNVRHGLWKLVTVLNERHSASRGRASSRVALTDLYIRMVATGAITDSRLF